TIPMSRGKIPGRAKPEPHGPPGRDAVLDRLGELRSGDPGRVAAALRPGLPLDPLLTPQPIPLLAWNEVFEWSRAFLLLHAHRNVGQLVDALLDPDQD